MKQAVWTCGVLGSLHGDNYENCHNTATLKKGFWPERALTYIFKMCELSSLLFIKLSIPQYLYPPFSSEVLRTPHFLVHARLMSRLMSSHVIKTRAKGCCGDEAVTALSKKLLPYTRISLDRSWPSASQWPTNGIYFEGPSVVCIINTHLLDPATTQKSLWFSFRMKAEAGEASQTKISSACEFLTLEQELVRFGSLICLQEFRCTCPILRCLDIRLQCTPKWETSSAALSEVKCLCRAQLKQLKRERKRHLLGVTGHITQQVCVQEQPFPHTENGLKGLWSWDLESCFLSSWLYFLLLFSVWKRCLKRRCAQDPVLSLGQLNSKESLRGSHCWTFGTAVITLSQTVLATLVPSSVV